MGWISGSNLPCVLVVLIDDEVLLVLQTDLEGGELKEYRTVIAVYFTIRDFPTWMAIREEFKCDVFKRLLDVLLLFFILTREHQSDLFRKVAMVDFLHRLIGLGSPIVSRRSGVILSF